MPSTRPLLRALAVSVLLLSPAMAATPPAVTVLSDRHQEEDKLVFAAFTAETGIPVDLVDQEPDAVMDRLTQRNAGDLFLSVGVAPLSHAAERGLLQPIQSTAALLRAVPDTLRDRGLRWVGLTWWARVLAYRTDRFTPADLAHYEDLADPKFQGQVLVRSGSSPYNQALLASLIAANGVEDTETWARGLVANFARPPQGGDSDQLTGLSQGDGGVAIVNTRYWARLAGSDRDTGKETLDGLALAFPNQDNRGTEIDIVGVALLRNAPHVKAAERLIEYLLRPEVQAKFAAVNFEYPVRPNVPPVATLQALGSFKTDATAVAKLGIFTPEAEQVVQKAGWQ